MTSGHDLDDAALVRLVRTGELERFNDLVDRHQTAAYNLALRMLGAPDLAGDLTQDAFLAAYRHLDSYRGGSFRAWLLRILTNACYDELRRRQRQRVDSLDELIADEESPFEPADPAAGPATQVERQELQQRLAALLLRLPAEFRAVVILADVQGYAYDEIAQVLEIELGTVKSRLSRARGRLRDLLRAEQELYDEAERLVRSRRDAGR